MRQLCAIGLSLSYSNSGSGVVCNPQYRQLLDAPRRGSDRQSNAPAELSTKIAIEGNPQSCKPNFCTVNRVGLHVIKVVYTKPYHHPEDLDAAGLPAHLPASMRASRPSPWRVHSTAISSNQIPPEKARKRSVITAYNSLRFTVHDEAGSFEQPVNKRENPPKSGSWLGPIFMASQWHPVASALLLPPPGETQP
ncbi:hypothetical protein SAMN05216237_1247 [Pseudomonas yamanorum]|nr:hypothetical protein SAMN05216237_1247 [Pseudomonas yamanorum]